MTQKQRNTTTDIGLNTIAVVQMEEHSKQRKRKQNRTDDGNDEERSIAYITHIMWIVCVCACACV